MTIGFRYAGQWVETAPLTAKVGEGRPIDPGAIRQPGFLIADKKAGPFRLEVDWIKAL